MTKQQQALAQLKTLKRFKKSELLNDGRIIDTKLGFIIEENKIHFHFGFVKFTKEELEVISKTLDILKG